MIIYSYKIANTLISEGFRLKKVEPSRTDSSKIVYVFKTTDELIERVLKLGIKIKE